MRNVESFHSHAQRQANRDVAERPGFDISLRQSAPQIDAPLDAPFGEAFGKDTVLVDEVIHAELKRYPLRQLEARLAYYKREYDKEPNPFRRRAFRMEVEKTRFALRWRQMNPTKELPLAAE